MRDPFAAALEVQFRAPGSEAAVYTPAAGDPLPIRVIRSRGTSSIEFGRGEILDDTNVVQIKRSDVAQPERDAELAIGAELFIIQDGGRLDAEGLTWTCRLEPA